MQRYLVRLVVLGGIVLPVPASAYGEWDGLVEDAAAIASNDTFVVASSSGAGAALSLPLTMPLGGLGCHTEQSLLCHQHLSLAPGIVWMPIGSRDENKVLFTLRPGYRFVLPVGMDASASPLARVGIGFGSTIEAARGRASIGAELLFGKNVRDRSRSSRGPIYLNIILRSDTFPQQPREQRWSAGFGVSYF